MTKHYWQCGAGTLTGRAAAAAVVSAATSVSASEVSDADTLVAVSSKPEGRLWRLQGWVGTSTELNAPSLPTHPQPADSMSGSLKPHTNPSQHPT